MSYRRQLKQTNNYNAALLDFVSDSRRRRIFGKVKISATQPVRRFVDCDMGAARRNDRPAV